MKRLFIGLATAMLFGGITTTHTALRKAASSLRQVTPQLRHIASKSCPINPVRQMLPEYLGALKTLEKNTALRNDYLKKVKERNDNLAQALRIFEINTSLDLYKAKQESNALSTDAEKYAQDFNLVSDLESLMGPNSLDPEKFIATAQSFPEKVKVTVPEWDELSQTVNSPDIINQEQTQFNDLRKDEQLAQDILNNITAIEILNKKLPDCPLLGESELAPLKERISKIQRSLSAAREEFVDYPHKLYKHYYFVKKNIENTQKELKEEVKEAQEQIRDLFMFTGRDLSRKKKSVFDGLYDPFKMKKTRRLLKPLSPTYPEAYQRPSEKVSAEN